MFPYRRIAILLLVLAVFGLTACRQDSAIMSLTCDFETVEDRNFKAADGFVVFRFFVSKPVFSGDERLSSKFNEIFAKETDAFIASYENEVEGYALMSEDNYIEWSAEVWPDERIPENGGDFAVLSLQYEIKYQNINLISVAGYSREFTGAPLFSHNPQFLYSGRTFDSKGNELALSDIFLDESVYQSAKGFYLSEEGVVLNLGFAGGEEHYETVRFQDGELFLPEFLELATIKIID